MNVDLTVTDTLFATQTVDSNIKGLTVEDWMAFNQLATQNIQARDASTFIRIVQLATTGKSIALSIAQTLTFAHVAIPRAFNVAIVQQFYAWSDIHTLPFDPLVRHQLGLGQVATAQVAKAAYDSLELSHTIGLEYTKNLAIEQTLTTVSSGTAYKPDKYWTSYDIEVIVP